MATRTMVGATAALLTAALACGAAAPAARSAAPTFRLTLPRAGDIAVGHVAFQLKSRSTAKLALANGRLLPRNLLAVGGVKRIRGPRYIATLVLVRSRTTNRPNPSGARQAAARIRLSKRGVFRRFTSRKTAVNVFGTRTRPPFCSSIPSSFGYIARKPLHGSLLSGFGAAATARLAYLAGCRSSAQAEAFEQAVAGNSATGNPGAEEEGDCVDGSTCGDTQSPSISPTLRGSGTVTRDALNAHLYRYVISFNEPVSGYLITAPGTVRCPAPPYASWYSECVALGSSITPSTGATAVTCQDPASTLVSDFLCLGRELYVTEDGESVREEVPAGTPISGIFTMNPDQVRAGSVVLKGFQARRIESPDAPLTGP